MLQFFLILLNFVIGIVGVLRPERQKHLWKITIIPLLVIVALTQTIVTKQKNKDYEGLRNYSSVSKLGPNGKSVVAGFGLIYTTRLSRIMEGTYTEENGRAYFKCDDQSLERYNQAIKEDPCFPFSYLAMAHCLEIRGDTKWREYASKAKSILEITTKIGGHNKSHDEALKMLLQASND